ncbi:MerR family transcriptional regulator [Streptomyces parvulus]|uniref:MerR family transcriptional regulator n=1 Tax=Streptomyces parvulus TaxID=146923 RepID=A0A369UXW3_9ACTN|nr:MerR family transcriptional regulator [Streptomyces parvulus]RDD85317.1 MerR family transcriptional regulator [Streptomyces parvulus]
MRIGELARRAGVSTRALRYYEEQGLLHPQRTVHGHRDYPESAVSRVALIRQLYAAGLTSRLIFAVLPAIDARHLEPALLRRLLDERAGIHLKLAELQEKGRRLDMLIERATQPSAEPCPALLDSAPHGPSPTRRRGGRHSASDNTSG